MSQGPARAGTVDLAAPQRREEAALLVGLRVAKQAELDAVVRQSADVGERVRAGPGNEQFLCHSHIMGHRQGLHAHGHEPCQHGVIALCWQAPTEQNSHALCA